MTATSAMQSPPLSGLHLLLTYECNYECDHCFVWGGPSQGGTMTEEIIEHILGQAEALGTIEWIYFEGGEPFLHHGLLSSGVRKARRLGFKVGIVSNASWATSNTEAMKYLEAFAGEVEDLSISDDAYHGCKDEPGETSCARQVANELGIPVEFISITGPEPATWNTVNERLRAAESNVQYRGRAAKNLAVFAPLKPWKQFTECPWEELRHPQRVHVDAYGNLHICQGISIGNLVEKPLTEIMASYDPDNHPIVGPLLNGGPAEIVNHYHLPHEPAYADACHLCYLSRCGLRDRFPKVLTPDQMYGAR